MAIENVKKFFELVKSDEELAREIAKIKDEIQNKGETVDYEQIISKKVIPMAKKHGLDFTMEDFLKYTNSMVQQGELSDDDLLNVSGGMNLRQGLATGFLLLSVGTTGLGLMANNIVGTGGGSSTGSQEAASAPTSSYTQSVDRTSGGSNEDYSPGTTESAKDLSTFNLSDAGSMQTTEESSKMEKNSGEGAAVSVSTNKNTAGGGAAGGAAGATTTTKATAGGAGSGAAGGTTTTTAKEDYGRFDDLFDDSFWGKDTADSSTTATEKQEYKKFGDAKWHFWGTTWQDIGDHILGELNNVGLDINNFSNIADATSDIGAFVKDAKKDEVDGDTYDKIKTSYDNYTTEVAKKDLAKKVAEEAAKKAAEKEAAKKEIQDLVESIKSGNDEEAKLNDFWNESSVGKQGIQWKGCVLSGSDAIVLLNAASKESMLDYTGDNAFAVASFNENAQDVKDAEISDLKDLSNKLDEGIKAGNTADWPQELKDRLENFKTGLKNVISEKEEAAKKEAEAKKAAEEAAKKEADAVKKVEYTGLKRDVLTLKSFADKVETINELAQVLKDSENGKNMTKESRAKLEADTLKLGFVLYDVNTGSFNVQGDDYFTFFEAGDEANIHAVENYYKEISKDLKDFNDDGWTPYEKAENLVNNLNKVNGEWYRFSPKTIKTVAQRINDAGDRVGQDDNGWFFNDGWVRNTQNRSSFDEGELKMIKTAADELANLAKK